MVYVVCITLIFALHFSSLAMEKNASDGPLKLNVLHLGFHLGCIKDFEEVGKALGFQLSSWHILQKPFSNFDGESDDFKIYNITHDKADKIWNKHKNMFEKFDIIVTSDTVPLSRVFLQNNPNKPLIIWICNRFDYDHEGGQEFPDQEYYDLFKKACMQKNVKVIGFTPYEHLFAFYRGISTGMRTIKPIGSSEVSCRDDSRSFIPENIDKKNSFFVFSRSQQRKYVKDECDKIGINSYEGRFNGPYDLKDFKGIIYLPYEISNLIFWEGIQHGIIFFVPSKAFMRELVNEKNAFPYCRLPGASHLDEFINWMEWYAESNQDNIVYFDSWQDLAYKIKILDYDAMHNKILAFAKSHRQETIDHWKQVFEEFKHDGFVK